jgi:hypothetical protein
MRTQTTPFCSSRLICYAYGLAIAGALWTLLITATAIS